MEQSEVAAAIDQLQKAGKPVSNGNIKKVLKYGSMRDIVKHRKALALLTSTRVELTKAMDPAPVVSRHPGEPWKDGRVGRDPDEPLAPVIASPPGARLAPWQQPVQAIRGDNPTETPQVNGTPEALPPPDQVQRCLAVLTACESEVTLHRDALQKALLDLFVVAGVVVDGQRYGPLAANDPARDAAKHAAVAAQQDYEQAWSALLAAQAALTAAQTAQRLQAKERFVEKHHPALVAEWQDAQRDLHAPDLSDRQRDAAKVRFQDVQYRYQSAVHAAPTSED
jgi:hypothetical protein